MKRNDFIDGFSLLGLAIVLATIYDFRNDMFFHALDLIGAIFCALAGAFILSGKGHWLFKE